MKYHKYDGGFWFRVFGKGLSVVDRKKHKPLFSLRNGYRRALWFGGWTLEGLT